MAAENISDSILTSVKKLLGLTEEYDAFDVVIIIHINSVFTILTQLGIGPSDGFMIEDKNNKWSEFIEDQLPQDHIKISFEEGIDENRTVTLEYTGPVSKSIVEAYHD